MQENFSLGWFLLGIAPFLLGLIVYGMYILLVKWRKEVYSLFGDLRGKIRQQQNRLAKVRTQSLDFSIDDPGEYGEKARKISELQVQAELKAKRNLQSYSTLNEDARGISGNRELKGLLIKPIHWKNLLERTRELMSEVISSDITLDEIETMQAQMVDFSWSVAKSCQDLVGKIKDSQVVLEKIHSYGFNDNTIQKAGLFLEDWLSSFLIQVPIVYLSSDQDIILKNSDKHETIRVLRLYQSASPQILQTCSQINNWFELIIQREKVLETVQREFGLANKQIESLEQSEISLTLLESKRKMFNYQSSLQALMDKNNQNLVLSLESQNQQANILLSEIQQLSASLGEMKKQLAEYIFLSKTDEIQNAGQKLRLLAQTANNLARYHLRNYDASDQVGELHQELDKAISLIGKVERAIRETTIPETMLTDRLENFRSLYNSLRKIPPRVNNAQIRLQELDRIRDLTMAEQNKGKILIGELLGILEANTFLKKKYFGEAKKIQNQIDQSAEEVKQTADENFLKKINQSEHILRQIPVFLEKCNSALESEIIRRQKSIEELLVQLRKFIRSDDHLIMETERSIHSLHPGSSGDSAESGLKMLTFLQQNWARDNDIFERFETVAIPIIQEHSRLEKNRENAQEAKNKYSRVLPDNAESWPPTTRKPGIERSIFDSLEKRYEALHLDKQYLEGTAEKINQLSEEYQTIEQKLLDVVSMAQEEQNRYRDQERRLEESKRMWTRVAANNRNRQRVVEGVEKLLTNTQKEAELIQRQYSKGEINAQISLQRIRTICRKLNESVVEVDSQSMIDINGEIQRLI